MGTGERGRKIEGSRFLAALGNTSRPERYKFILVFPLLISIIFVGAAYWSVAYGCRAFLPYVKKEKRWSISIYMGQSPFHVVPVPNITNPVLTAKDVTDVPAKFVADPFMVNEDHKTWFIFFEVLNARNSQGDIGLATSNDGLHWKYRQIVLDEPFHLSYPYVFKWKGEYYMIPESGEANDLRLYKAVRFPTRWSFVKELLRGHYADSSIVYYDSKWWIFSQTNPRGHDTLRLYYAVDLMGPWLEHPKSPIIEGNAHIARPGGRVLVLNGHVVRFTQDDDPEYGIQLRGFVITELTTTTYREEEVKENPILKARGVGWNGSGMHHIDPHRMGKSTWIAAVDGDREVWTFRVNRKGCRWIPDEEDWRDSLDMFVAC